MSPLRGHPALAVGPAMPGWGSWDWVGTFILEHLSGPFRATRFEPWQLPSTDVVVIVKHAPPIEWIQTVTRRSSVIFCPIDAYSDPSEIHADAGWIRKCASVVVHCHRLKPYFAPLAETAYLDHPIRFATPTRKIFRAD